MYNTQIPGDFNHTCKTLRYREISTILPKDSDTGRFQPYFPKAYIPEILTMLPKHPDTGPQEISTMLLKHSEAGRFQPDFLDTGRFQPHLQNTQIPGDFSRTFYTHRCREISILFSKHPDCRRLQLCFVNTLTAAIYAFLHSDTGRFQPCVRYVEVSTMLPTQIYRQT